MSDENKGLRQVHEFSYIRGVMTSPSSDPLALRAVLGRFATGVTIVTCRDEAGAPVGLTANSFAALSLVPPLVLWSLRRISPSLAAFRASRQFAINVLAESQVDLSRRFASPVTDKFNEGAWSDGLGGAPVLSGAAAVLECELLSEQQAGDHVLFIGRVLKMDDLATPALVFQGGHYRMLGEVL
jgi:flavin reductase (DIM6/NTAB) family NADH-FMN oxidoreductase RutF